MLVAHGLPHDAKVDGFGLLRSAPYVKGTVVQLVLQLRGKDRANFSERVTRRQRELIISLARYLLGAQRQGLDFLFREHQGRKEEAGLQDIAKARLTVDLCAQALQVGDVAINRSQRHTRLSRKVVARHRGAVPPQDLHEVE